MDLQKLLESADSVIEKKVLSKIITSGKIPFGLSPEYFTGQNERLFREITQQIEKYGNLDRAILKEKHTAYHECLQFDGTASDVAIDLLYENFAKRKLAELFYKSEFENTVEDLRRIQSGIAQILFKTNSGIYDHGKKTEELLNALESFQKLKKDLPGYSTKLTELDSVSRGVEKGKVYAIGALKKTGKSRFGVFLSCVLKSQGAGVFWNSLEMSAEQLNLLALSYYSGINSNRFGSTMTYEEFRMLAESFGFFRELEWSIYKDHTVADMKARIIEERTRKSVDVCFIDFIQRMRSPKYTKDRVREVEDIAQGVADMARDLNVAVILFSQLAGSAEKIEGDEMPNMSHFKESQGIPENADSIWTFHNPKRHESPFSESGGYILQEFKIKVEQRYNISGSVVSILGDMRNCRFKDDIKQ